MSDTHPLAPEEEFTDGNELRDDLGQHWSTLAEQGNVLPVAAGDRSFAFKPMSLRLRTEAAAAMAPHKTRETGTGLFTFGLAASLESLQGIPTAGRKVEEVVAQLRQLPWTSVLYLTYRLQLEKQAGEDALQLGQCRCSVCGRPHRSALASLGGMRVRAYGQLQELPEQTLELRDGLRFGGKVARQVTIRPAPWDFMARLVDAHMEQTSQVLLAALRSAICRLDTHEGNVTPDEAAVGSLSDRDTELLDAEHVLLSGGPTSVVQAQCQGHTWPVLHHWQSATFFASSRERSSRRRTSLRK